MRTHLLALTCVTLLGSALQAQTIAAPFDADYSLTDLGAPAGVPGNLGGLALRRDQPDTLYVVGLSTRADAAVYRMRLVRDEVGHVVGFDGGATFHAASPNADGGLQFGRGGVLFFTRYGMNELGQIRPGSVTMDKSIALTPLGIASSVGGLSFVPWGHVNAGDLTILSFNASRTYTATLVPDGAGTFDISTVTPGTMLSGGTEGYVYVPPRSPQFADYGDVIVCEWGAHEVTTYELDANGDPDPSTRRIFVGEIPSCQGAVIDPISGDLLIGIYGTTPAGNNNVFAIRGFGAWRIRRGEGRPTTTPGIQLR